MEMGKARWEAVVGKESLRVLLVEADACTRQILVELLRKSGYQVYSAPDGLKAWEILKANQQEIDLILMEVELPLLSGFDLLTMIMENEYCKNIPVIGMSSNNTLNMIFKFLLMGVADFLVKPLRKNELRNLWRHVWRRYCLKNASGEKNDEHIDKAVQKKPESDLENAAADDSYSSFSSCEKKRTDCNSKESDMPRSWKCLSRDSEVPCLQNTQEPRKTQPQGSTDCSDACGVYETRCENSYHYKPCTVTPDTFEATDKPICRHEHEHTPTGVKASSDSEVLADSRYPISNLSSMTELDLSLKMNEASESAFLAINMQNVLNHSNTSAFSSYKRKHTASTPSGWTDSQLEDEERVRKIQQTTELKVQDQSYRNPNYATQLSNKTFSLNGEDTSSTLTTTSSNQDEKTVQNNNICIVPCMVPASAGYSNSIFFPSIDYMAPPPLGAPPWMVDTAFMKAMPVHSSSKSSQQVHDSEKQEIENRPSSAGEGESSNMCDSLHKEPVADIRGSISDVSNGVVEKDVPRSATEGHDDKIHWSIQKLEALNRFREKKKKRCFEKKVRYPTRKKLAEQRPRIKGQFVNRVSSLSMSENTNQEVV